MGRLRYPVIALVLAVVILLANPGMLANEAMFPDDGDGINHVSSLKAAYLGADSYLAQCWGVGKIVCGTYPHVMDMRKLGSAGLEIAWVAAGKGEAYFTTRIEPWDVAAGTLLIQEAGGEVTDFQGSPWKLQTGDLLFSNGKVHQKLLDLIT